MLLLKNADVDELEAVATALPGALSSALSTVGAWTTGIGVVLLPLGVLMVLGAGADGRVATALKHTVQFAVLGPAGLLMANASGGRWWHAAWAVVPPLVMVAAGWVAFALSRADNGLDEAGTVDA